MDDDDDGLKSDRCELEVEVDPAVTPELYRQWRAPRRGGANPERMNNPVWEWLVKTRLSAFWVAEKFKAPSAFDAGPGWCFQRFGQTSTVLPDGRTVLIAGEHEDYYDPDFFIYNDVVVLHPGGVCDIFGYPREVFPPTDFHSATLVGNSVIMIGSLGYLAGRKPGATQVLILDLESMGVRPMWTSGDSPGWIHNHEATLDEDGKSILICGGKTAEVGLTGRLTENVDYWRLRLADGHWQRMTRREWRRWRLSGGHSGRSVWWGIIEGARSDPGLGDSIAEMIEKMAPDLGRPPNFAIAKELFSPPVSHERALADGEGTGIYRIVVEGIVVRYVVEPGEVVLTIEGSLPSATETLLLADLREKLQRLWEAPFEVEEL